MKLLILGGNGMLGHHALTYFQTKYETKCTITSGYSHNSPRYTNNNTFFLVNALEPRTVENAIREFEPDYVLNCIAVIKQHHESKDYISRSIEINSLFPHKLAKICKKYDAKLFHISTDCVFNGKKGNYKETDISDAEDIYGQTKYLGEISTYYDTVTLRTSIIGREIKNYKCLVEWLFAQRGGKILGHVNSIYTGLTCIELCKILDMLMTYYPTASGLYHIASEPIVKADLLEMINKRYELGIDIVPFEDFHIDRSLDSSLFKRHFCYNPPTWEEMIGIL